MFSLTKYVCGKGQKDTSRRYDLFDCQTCFSCNKVWIFRRALNFIDTYFSVLYFCNLGLGSKQIYLKNGNSSNVAELLESFKKDARSVKLRAGKHQLEDVTDVLKSFLSQIDDALLTKELYPFWISALGNICSNTQYKKGWL